MSCSLCRVSCSEFASEIRVSILTSSEGGEKVTGSSRALCQAHHAWRAPHFDGGVVAGGQQELLVGGAEGHGVHHVVVLQAGQTDVVMPVPDVAVLVFSTTAEQQRWKKRVNTKDEPIFLQQYVEVELHMSTDWCIFCDITITLKVT